MKLHYLCEPQFGARLRKRWSAIIFLGAAFELYVFHTKPEASSFRPFWLSECPFFLFSCKPPSHIYVKQVRTACQSFKTRYKRPSLLTRAICFLNVLVKNLAALALDCDSKDRWLVGPHFRALDEELG